MENNKIELKTEAKELKKLEEAELKIVKFDLADVIATSGCCNG